MDIYKFEYIVYYAKLRGVKFGKNKNMQTRRAKFFPSFKYPEIEHEFH